MHHTHTLSTRFRGRKRTVVESEEDNYPPSFLPRILHSDPFCHHLLSALNKKLTAGQPMGGLNAHRLGGHSVLSLGLEGEQSTLECCFWKAVPYQAVLGLGCKIRT